MNRTPNNPTAATRREPKAFTLLELMTVVLIIGLVLTILMPTLAQVRTMFLSRKTQHIINLISHACAAYRSDIENYPADAWELVQALTGRDDGDDKKGYGFRLVERGKVYGPYGGTEKLRIDTQDQ
ncbi:MAG: type II secretion system protein, partial [Planctomycetota bacterium]